MSRWFYLGSQFALIAALSLICKYSLQVREGYVVNFDIATMLTPSGLLHNLALDTESVLRPFYDRTPERDGMFTSVATGLLAIGASGCGLVGLILLRQKVKP